mmetsp:Transcript_35987/g.113024  ORF Transcript_35987/g.113024 Transcript_35987/m.113024 type:complete len:219 (-) Transcript_35987:93-749(-)
MGSARTAQARPRRARLVRGYARGEQLGPSVLAGGQSAGPLLRARSSPASPRRPRRHPLQRRCQRRRRHHRHRRLRRHRQRRRHRRACNCYLQPRNFLRMPPARRACPSMAPVRPLAVAAGRGGGGLRMATWRRWRTLRWRRRRRRRGGVDHPDSAARCADARHRRGAPTADGRLGQSDAGRLLRPPLAEGRAAAASRTPRRRGVGRAVLLLRPARAAH